jgi:predicted nuclease with TOPRIM domain
MSIVDRLEADVKNEECKSGICERPYLFCGECISKLEVELQADLDSKNETISDLEDIVSELRVEIRDLEREVEDLKSKVDEYEMQLEAINDY